jgi:hypothetical protein
MFPLIGSIVSGLPDLVLYAVIAGLLIYSVGLYLANRQKLGGGGNLLDALVETAEKTTKQNQLASFLGDQVDHHLDHPTIGPKLEQRLAAKGYVKVDPPAPAASVPVKPTA